MKLEEAKREFVRTWARLGSEWGINRTMAQVHALLLVSHKSLTADEIMEALQISRGNANINIRELINWNLVYRETVTGARKEYFRAEKDIWEIAKRIARERKKREIEPVLHDLKHLTAVDEQGPEAAQFLKTVKDIHGFASKIDRSIDTMLKADESWFFGTIIKLLT